VKADFFLFDTTCLDLAATLIIEQGSRDAAGAKLATECCAAATETLAGIDLGIYVRLGYSS